MSSPNQLVIESGSNERWKFFRDVLVFQLKMLLDNVRDFALMPVSLVAALIDLIYALQTSAFSILSVIG